MGEIADAHVAAFAAGLDPNEMDGADWAEFFDDEAPPSIATIIGCISGDCRMLLTWIDDLQMQDGEELDASTEARAKTLCQYIPGFGQSDATALIDALVKLNTAALAEEGRLDTTETDA